MDTRIERLLAGRRELLKLACAGALVIAAPAGGTQQTTADLGALLARLERESGGRLGVGIVGLQSGLLVGYRLDERFAMCSTFKLLLVALILIEIQAGRLRSDTPIQYDASDMLSYAPVTAQFLERGYMSIAALAEAAQTASDNVAANLLLDLIGGPAGFTQKLRAIGDASTRLDRYEPDMNFVPHGELRDTTTPGAMATTVHKILCGSMLSGENGRNLRAWMQNTRTGLDRLRAGFPEGWRSGDKTGTGIAPGMPNKYNDIAVVWPGNSNPGFVIAAYFEADGEYDDVRDTDVAILRDVGRIVANRMLSGAIQ